MTRKNDHTVLNSRLKRRSVIKSLALGAGGVALASAGGASLLPKVWAAASSNGPQAYKTDIGTLDLSTVPKLDRERLGYLRHVLNLAGQLDGDWSHMMTGEVEEHGLASLRYQLGHLVYALGLAHYHHLPAAPGVFKEPMARLNAKMMRHEVWRYWYEESRSSPRFDPDIKAPREPWADPVVKENIMYSGHIHAMAGMYDVLFNDDKYEQPGSITFRNERMWGGDEVFDYDLASLNQTIYWQMVESGWLGVPCEPNMVFIICNQLPMLGFRFHDIRKGTDIASEATSSFKASWEKRGVMTEGGQFVTFYQVRQDRIIPSEPAVDAHTATFMNAWNRDVVRDLFPDQVYYGLRTAADGTIAPYAKSLLPQLREAKANGAQAGPLEDRSYQWRSPDFGFMSLFLSEIGDTETLGAMMAHADQYMNPTWEREGLYFPRNDNSFDDKGNMVYMDPLTGNAALAYARLNVKDGMWALYNKPWGQDHFAQPQLSQVPDSVDVLRAQYVADKAALVLTLAGRGGQAQDATLEIANLPKGRDWSLFRDGELMATNKGQAAGGLSVREAGDRLVLNGAIAKETDIVLLIA